MALASAYGIKRAYFDKVEEPVVGPPAEERVVPVETVTASRVRIWDRVSGVGTVRADREVTVVSKTTGTVEEIFFDVGDLVRKGEKLARIEDYLLRLEVREARAGLAEARSSLEKMLSFTLPEEIRVKRATVDSAQARYMNARKEWERMRRLASEGIIARKSLETSEMALKVAEADHRVATERLALAESGARREDLEMAQARLRRAEARLARMERKLNDTTVDSPIDGVVAERMVEAGGGAVASAPLFKIIDVSKVVVVMEVAEREIARVREGGDAEVRVDSYPGKRFTGRVTKIHPQADIRSRTFPVEVTVENREGPLKPGMVARVVITGKYRGEMVLIPRDAVQADAQGPYVYVVTGDRAAKYPVVRGRRRGERVIIISGLSGGEQMIRLGLENITDGTKVEVMRKRPLR